MKSDKKIKHIESIEESCIRRAGKEIHPGSFFLDGKFEIYNVKEDELDEIVQNIRKLKFVKNVCSEPTKDREEFLTNTGLEILKDSFIIIGQLF